MPALTQGSGNSLRYRLRQKFRQLNRQIKRRKLCGLVLDDAGDDLEVFRQLMEMDIAHLKLTEFGFLDDWELQFNQLRSLRPARMTGEAIKSVSQPF